MICVRKDLIQEELKSDVKNGFQFGYQKLSNQFIDWLFRHYYVHELCENFYDSEPEFDDELYNMYLDYGARHEMTGLAFWNIVINMDEMEEKKSDFRYSKESHTESELKAAYDEVIRMYREYDEKRIEFCNWQEPHFKGNWGVTQRQVDLFGRFVMKQIRQFPRSIKSRLYYAKKGDQIRIYFYGRDLWKKDYWFIFRKRDRRLRGMAQI